MQFMDFLTWFSIISLAVNIILGFIAIWQLKDARSEKARKKDQVKIWMQDANGISQALTRIVIDNLDKRYSSTNDMANAVWAVQSSAFALNQSLYEERCVTEEEYKQFQDELKQEFKKQREQQLKGTKQTIVNVPLVEAKDKK